MPSLNELSYVIGGVANDKGFWGEPNMMDKYAAKLALVHSEVTEVLEALRKDKGGYAVTEEICDVIIRLLDVYDKLVVAQLATDNIDEVMEMKVATNAARPALHGHKWG